MENNEEKVPSFIREYLEKMDYEGYADFVKLSREYHKEREEYPGKFAEQSAHLNNYNRTAGQNRKLNYEDELKRMDARYKQRAYETAKQHGFKGTDPNQPSDREFSKQGIKFQGMIDGFQQRPRQKEHQPDPETKNLDIDKLKGQQPYQQNQPKVAFKEIKKEATETEQTGREQQRSAFLEQVRQTREQAQRSADRELEP